MNNKYAENHYFPFPQTVSLPARHPSAYGKHVKSNPHSSTQTHISGQLSLYGRKAFSVIFHQQDIFVNIYRGYDRSYEFRQPVPFRIFYLAQLLRLSPGFRIKFARIYPRIIPGTAKT